MYWQNFIVAAIHLFSSVFSFLCLCSFFTSQQTRSGSSVACSTWRLKSQKRFSNACSEWWKHELCCKIAFWKAKKTGISLKEEESRGKGVEGNYRNMTYVKTSYRITTEAKGSTKHLFLSFSFCFHLHGWIIAICGAMFFQGSVLLFLV